MEAKGLLDAVRNWVRRPANGVLIAALVLLVISLVLNYRHTAYNSDDVVWQNALQHWRPFSGDIFFGDKDVAFILQAPIYWLVSLVIAPGRHAMLLDGLLLALINFVLVYIASLYFLRLYKVKITYLSLLPFLWLATFGFGLSRLFIGTNVHTLSVGLIFTLLMLVSKLCNGELAASAGWRRWFVYAATALFVGMSIVNDRYFIYFGIVPALALIALYAYKKRMSSRCVAIIVAIILAGAIASIVIVHILARIGILLVNGVGTPQFVGFSDIGAYVTNALHGLFVITGTDFLGQPLVSVATLVSLVNLVLVMAVITGAVTMLKRKARPELLVLAGLAWFTLLTLAFSSFNKGAIENYRYLVLIPFLMPLILIVTGDGQPIAKLRQYRVALVAAIALNVGVSAFGAWPALASPIIDNHNQVPNYQLITTLENTGVSKGYSEYWSANINSYLSSDKLNVQPVKCVGTTTLPYVWFIDKKRYLAPSQRSFYIFAASRPLCSPAAIRQQFGAPAKQLKTGDYIVWLYNYDISRNMDLSDIKNNRINY